MTEHEQKPEQSRSEPVDQPEHVDTPTEGEHLSSPEPGHPAGETSPREGVPERVHEHPEDIGETPSDEAGAESATRSPAPEEDVESD